VRYPSKSGPLVSAPIDEGHDPEIDPIRHSLTSAPLRKGMRTRKDKMPIQSKKENELQEAIISSSIKLLGELDGLLVTELL
jgi:hypothetical protein